MSVVLLPVRRLRANHDRSTLRRGMAIPTVAVQPLRVLREAATVTPAYCAGCAAPIEFGAVVRGHEAYCSVECFLDGDRPA
jgi:hypothetical protein